MKIANIMEPTHSVKHFYRTVRFQVDLQQNFKLQLSDLKLFETLSSLSYRQQNQKNVEQGTYANVCAVI